MFSCNFQKDIIQAIAEADATGVEQALLDLLATQDQNLQKVTLYALSQIGSATSLNALGALAEKSAFTMENTGANEAYIALIKKLAADGNTQAA